MIKIILIAAVLSAVAVAAAMYSPRSSNPTAAALPTPDPTPPKQVVPEIGGYRTWNIASKRGFKMDREVAIACAAPVMPVATEGTRLESSPHKDHYINVYVNSVGVKEMFYKKFPRFPVGTVIVKEKLPEPDSVSPELMTVMIKRKKGFNPDYGDWEFMTGSGDGTEITARGRLESCQKCHADYPRNDFVTRVYLEETYKNAWK